MKSKAAFLLTTISHEVIYSIWYSITLFFFCNVMEGDYEDDDDDVDDDDDDDDDDESIGF